MLRNTLNTFITATFIMLLGVSSSAQAIVPMGDLMGSSSVTFSGQAEATKHSSALTIDLVPNAPTIKEQKGTVHEVQGNKVTVTYTITSEANGPDDYALAADYDGDAAAAANLEGSPTTAIQNTDDEPIAVPMSLGATAATGVVQLVDGPNNWTSITVPSDGIVDDAVNGIRADA